MIFFLTKHLQLGERRLGKRKEVVALCIALWTQKGRTFVDVWKDSVSIPWRSRGLDIR